MKPDTLPESDFAEAKAPVAGNGVRQFPPEKLRKLTGFVERRRRPVEQVLEGTGIDIALLNRADLRITLAQLARAYQNASRMAGEEPWAINIGRELGLTDYGFYGYALICSPTLRKALEFAIKYHQLAAPTVVMSLDLQDGRERCALRVEDKLHNPETYRFNIELQIGLMLSLLRDVLGQDFRLDRVTLRYAKPPYHAALRQLMEAPIEFDANHNSLEFDAARLDTPLRRANLSTWQATRSICDELLEPAISGTSVTHAVYQNLIRDTFRCATITDVAAAMRLSERTLRRRLAGENTSFRQIRGTVLGRLAVEFVTNTRMTAEEISERLGFSDASSFCKAFKNWTGQRMSEFRPHAPHGRITNARF